MKQRAVVLTAVEAMANANPIGAAGSDDAHLATQAAAGESSMLRLLAEPVVMFGELDCDCNRDLRAHLVIWRQYLVAHGKTRCAAG